MKTKSFKDLFAWQKAYQLVLETYRVTNQFPHNERFGLTQQMRRAAVSVPSNIAEGYGRQHKNEYRQALAVAYGSLCELETQYLLAVDLTYVQQSSTAEGLLKEVGSMLYRMINPVSVRSNSIRSTLNAIH